MSKFKKPYDRTVHRLREIEHIRCLQVLSGNGATCGRTVD